VDNRYAGAVLFCIALLSICYFGFNLYTGKVGFLWTTHDKDALSMAFLGLLGNLLGTLLTQSEISLFTSITQSPGSSDTAGLQDCIDRLKSLSSQSEMDLNKLAETLRERKSYR
jgi:hypothetical protein